MTPELPIEMSDASKIISAANLPEMPCSMRRMNVQCGNAADKAFLYPLENGCYATVAACNMCLDEIMRF